HERGGLLAWNLLPSEALTFPPDAEYLREVPRPYFPVPLVSTSKSIALLPAWTSLTTVLRSLNSGGKACTLASVRTPGGAVGSWILVPAFLNARSSTRFVPTVTPFLRRMWYCAPCI